MQNLGEQLPGLTHVANEKRLRLTIHVRVALTGEQPMTQEDREQMNTLLSQVAPNPKLTETNR